MNNQEKILNPVLEQLFLKYLHSGNEITPGKQDCIFLVENTRAPSYMRTTRDRKKYQNFPVIWFYGVAGIHLGRKVKKVIRDLPVIRWSVYFWISSSLWFIFYLLFWLCSEQSLQAILNNSVSLVNTYNTDFVAQLQCSRNFLDNPFSHLLAQ